MPRFSEDDVIDFMVTEALVHRGRASEEKAEKTQKQSDFMHSHKDFDPTKPSPGG